MRQAGVLAAAGIVALEEMVDRLGEDHQRAEALAAGLREVPGLLLDKRSPNTNMVYVEIEGNQGVTAQECAAKLKEKGILVGITGSRHFRMVCHYWIRDEHIPAVLNAFKNALSK